MFWLMYLPVTLPSLLLDVYTYWFDGSSTMHTGPLPTGYGFCGSEIGTSAPVDLDDERRDRAVRSCVDRLVVAVVQHVEKLVLRVGHAVDRVEGQRQVRHRAVNLRARLQPPPRVYGRIWLVPASVR